MIVGCDLDNVIVAIVESARRLMAKDLGIPLEEIENTNIYWEPFTHSDPAVAAKLKPDFEFWNRDELLSGCEALPDAVESAWRLYDAGVLACYITRRPAQVAHLTRAWLMKHDMPPVPVEHVGGADSASYYQTCKSVVCRRYGITHMIDDHAGEADMLREAGIEVVLVDAAIGRAARQEFLATHPHVAVAPDITGAVNYLLRQQENIAA